MDDYDNSQELELKEQITAAVTANDFDTVKQLMLELLKVQKDAPKVEMTDEQLADKGVLMKILYKERHLREQYHQAQQDGDFVKCKQIMRELRQLQKLQPEYTGVRLA